MVTHTWKKLLQRTTHQNKDSGATIALLSHRLRTPLTSAKWYVELLLKEEFGTLKIAQLEFLDKVHHGIVDAIDVLNRFLEVSRVESGRIVAQPIAVDVREAVEEVIRSMQLLIEEKHHTVTLRMPRGHLVAFFNPLMCHAVIEGVVANAVAYTPPGGHISIVVRASSRGGIAVEVTDTGIGITKRDMPRVFTKFFRADNAKELLTTGNGLGLYMVRRILLSAGGRVHCSSRLGKGSTFTVVLPTSVKGGKRGRIKKP